MNPHDLRHRRRDATVAVDRRAVDLHRFAVLESTVDTRTWVMGALRMVRVRLPRPSARRTGVSLPAATVAA
jgi:hypothetical protein